MTIKNKFFLNLITKNPIPNKEPQKIMSQTLSPIPKPQKIQSLSHSQNILFRQWTLQKNFLIFHTEHYDWWTFPLDQSSAKYGDEYKLDVQDVAQLRGDEEFLGILRENAMMVCRAWGWNLKEGRIYDFCLEGQEWRGNVVRLEKMCKALDLFRQNDLQLNALNYADYLLRDQVELIYKDKNLGEYFRARKKQLQDPNSITKYTSPYTLSQNKGMQANPDETKQQKQMRLLAQTRKTVKERYAYKDGQEENEVIRPRAGLVAGQHLLKCYRENGQDGEEKGVNGEKKDVRKVKRNFCCF